MRKRLQKEGDKQERLEKESVKSGCSKVSKYSVGNKLPSGAIVKEVKENDWEFVKREGGRDWFVCKHCKKVFRKDARKTHSC